MENRIATSSELGTDGFTDRQPGRTSDTNSAVLKGGCGERKNESLRETNMGGHRDNGRTASYRADSGRTASYRTDSYRDRFVNGYRNIQANGYRSMQQLLNPDLQANFGPCGDVTVYTGGDTFQASVDTIRTDDTAEMNVVKPLIYTAIIFLALCVISYIASV